MRIAAIEKMGYYPTPDIVTDLIARWLTLPSPETFWRLLDPCCGMGEAAAQLARPVGGECQTWGVELSPARAEAASQVLDKVHSTAWQAVRVQAKSVSLLWLNPPYDNDYEGDNKRVEIEFLRSALGSLAYGGILVYLIPQRILGYQEVARLLAGHFDHLAFRRFPDGEYERFKPATASPRTQSPPSWSRKTRRIHWQQRSASGHAVLLSTPSARASSAAGPSPTTSPTTPPAFSRCWSAMKSTR